VLVELDVVVLEAVAFVVWLLFTVEFDEELVVKFELDGPTTLEELVPAVAYE
jgi:hypothetical protein